MKDVKNAAELAHKGILTSVQYLCLKELDISKVEPDKMVNLLSIVEKKVRLYYKITTPKFPKTSLAMSNLQN